jgi:hypothetical protein
MPRADGGGQVHSMSLTSAWSCSSCMLRMQADRGSHGFASDTRRSPFDVAMRTVMLATGHQPTTAPHIILIVRQRA